MLTSKEIIKGALKALHLYNSMHNIWVRRPDPQILCWNAGYRIAGAEDHLPIPPTHLIDLVIYSKQIAWFLLSGSMAQKCISYALQKNEVQIEELNEILDFGCGCGRVLRHWKPKEGQQFWGTDYNPELIAWCQKHLNRIAQFTLNQLTPPMNFKNEEFDFIYAISVFTHLTEALQQAWLKEFSRVLKPNGLLYITVHGVSRLYQLNSQEKEQFLRGQLVVKQAEAVGTNFCAAFHPDRYIRNELAKQFEILDIIPLGARDADQDVCLLRKPDRIH
jgi:SAM-dependent methyltransferase